MSHSQLPTAHIATQEQSRRVSTGELAHIQANLGKLATGDHSTEPDRLVEGWQLATHDKLIPQLLNRDGIDEWFERYRPQNAAVMLLDVEKFKLFNDTYGQKVGDQILQHVGQLFLKKLRTEDKGPEGGIRRNSFDTDMLARNKDAAGARYGGDEFIAVVNLDSVDPKKHNEVMHSIQGRFSDFGSFSHEGKELPVHIRSVYQISTDPNETIDEIYEQLSPQLAAQKQAEKVS